MVARLARPVKSWNRCHSRAQMFRSNTAGSRCNGLKAALWQRGSVKEWERAFFLLRTHRGSQPGSP